jgi:hypothetical protein
VIDASPAALVAMWERTGELSIAERDRALLGFDSRAGQDIDAWTLGRRDAELAGIYRAIYGDRVEATVCCSTCDGQLEFETTIGALFGDAGRMYDIGAFCIRFTEYELTLQPLRVADIMSLPRLPNEAFDAVMRRCVLDVRSGERISDPAALPANVRDCVSDALRAADPGSEILISLGCTDCGAPNQIVFDIGAFLWEALDRSATAALTEVHVLAGAYGWSEREILGLPEKRRRRYLDLIYR